MSKSDICKSFDDRFSSFLVALENVGVEPRLQDVIQQLADIRFDFLKAWHEGAFTRDMLGWQTYFIQKLKLADEAVQDAVYLVRRQDSVEPARHGGGG